MRAAIVKIDLCSSKEFSAKHERHEPSIRRRTLERLVAIANNCFPAAEETYPKGTLYKADGDALWFVLDKTSVALRGAIEFMQSWFREAQTGFPDCRAFLDRGDVDEVPVADRVELTGAVFENISVFEKGLPESRIYVTRSVLQDCDPTMAKFTFVKEISARRDERFDLFVVDFADPRTIANSSLAHAMFIAHPKGVEARARVFELLLLQYFEEQEDVATLAGFAEWARSRNLSLPDEATLTRLIERSDYFERPQTGTYRLTAGARNILRSAHAEFVEARSECERVVEASVIAATNQQDASANVQLASVIEDYLCAVFAEIRMMANYFRATERMFDSGPETFARYDYILRRYLDVTRLRYFDEWRRGFLLGLREVAERRNAYVAAVFHNVLAMYYLNRAPATAAWQIDRLKAKRIFLDTNVVYSRIVRTSQYHELVTYFMGRLASIGAGMYVLPITLEEYEDALLYVQRNVDGGGSGSPEIVKRNPWLYQEFMLNKGKYLGSIDACREAHSITKGVPIEPPHYDELDQRLREYGVRLHRDQHALTDEEVDQLWVQHRNMMASNQWDMYRYMEFIYQPHPLSVRRHDMTCLVTLDAISTTAPSDALGPPILFITVDSKLRRLRSKYKWIVTPEQFMEFTLPYLFLADIPVEDAARFPNTLLAAQLGTLLVRRPPALVEIVGACLSDPSALDGDIRETFGSLSEDMARALNERRFKDVIATGADAPAEQRAELSLAAADALESYVSETRAVHQRRDEIQELREQLAERDRQIEKLEKKVHYFRHRPR